MLSSYKRLAPIFVAGALLVSACGGDDPLIQAMADDMVSQDAGLSSDPDEALCVSQASYDSLGAERLEELGVTVDNPDLTDAEVTPGEAEALVDGLYDCLDVNAMIIAQVTELGLPEANAKCAVDGLGPEAVRQLMIDQFGSGDPQLSSEAQGILLRCLSDS